MAEYEAFAFLNTEKHGAAAAVNIKQYEAAAVEKELPKFEDFFPTEAAAAVVEGGAGGNEDTAEAPAPRLIRTEAKHFWRTNDRIEFRIYEVRQHKTMVVIAGNAEDAENEFRPLYIDLEALYTVLENKAQSSPTVQKAPLEPLTKRQIIVDEDLWKTAADFLLQRLAPQKEPIPLPEWFGGADLRLVSSTPAAAAGGTAESGTAGDTAGTAVPADTTSAPAAAAPADTASAPAAADAPAADTADPPGEPYLERQVVLSKLHGDPDDRSLEFQCPASLKPVAEQLSKWRLPEGVVNPAAAAKEVAAAAASVADAAAQGEASAEGAAGASPAAGSGIAAVRALSPRKAAGSADKKEAGGASKQKPGSKKKDKPSGGAPASAASKAKAKKGAASKKG